MLLTCSEDGWVAALSPADAPWRASSRDSGRSCLQQGGPPWLKVAHASVGWFSWGAAGLGRHSFPGLAVELLLGAWAGWRCFGAEDKAEGWAQVSLVLGAVSAISCQAGEGTHSQGCLRASWHSLCVHLKSWHSARPQESPLSPGSQVLCVWSFKAPLYPILCKVRLIPEWNIGLRG